MSYIKCKCGNILELENFPSEDEFNFFSESLWSEVMISAAKAVIRSATMNPDLLRESISDSFVDNLQQFYKCPNCGRLIVFWAGETNGQFYRLDDS